MSAALCFLAFPAMAALCLAVGEGGSPPQKPPRRHLVTKPWFFGREAT